MNSSSLIFRKSWSFAFRKQRFFWCLDLFEYNEIIENEISNSIPYFTFSKVHSICSKDPFNWPLTFWFFNFIHVTILRIKTIILRTRLAVLFLYLYWDQNIKTNNNTHQHHSFQSVVFLQTLKSGYFASSLAIVVSTRYEIPENYEK